MTAKETPFDREPAEGSREVIDKELAKMKDKPKPTDGAKGDKPADGRK